MKAFIRKCKAKWMDTGVPNRWDWAIFGITFFLSYFVFAQGYDLLIITPQANEFIDMLFTGRILQYHDIVPHANYSEFIYLVYGLLLLPLRAAGWLFGVELHSSQLFVIFYGKFIISVWWAATSFIFCKLAKILGATKNNTKWALYLFLTSPILLYSSILFGQVDIFSVAFTLLALLHFCKKQYWLFTLVMIPAICCKVFALFIFIPLILLVEKRILRLGLYTLCAMSGFIGSRLLYMGSEGFKQTQQWAEEVYGFYGRFFSGNFFGHKISIFAFFFILICFACYAMRVNEKKIFAYVVSIPIIIYSFLFMFYEPFHVQWFTVITPYAALMILQQKNRRLALIADLLFQFGCLAVAIFVFHPHIRHLMNNALLPVIFQRTYEGPLLLDYAISVFPLAVAAIRTLYFASLTILAGMAAYQLLRKDDESSIDRPLLLDRSFIWLRPGILVIVVMIPLLVLHTIR